MAETPSDTGQRDFDADCEAINNLRHQFDIGTLANLAWNVRNNVLSDPEGDTPNDTVRRLIEGFIDEIRPLWLALDEAQLRSIEARNPGIDMEEVRRARGA